jgi:hypothetical protein
MQSPAPRRRIRWGAILLAAIAIPLALVTLLGLERLPLLPDTVNDGIAVISQSLIQLLAIVGALAVVIGVLNLTGVHLRSLRRMPNGLYSMVTLATMLLIIVLHVLERTDALRVGDSDTPLVGLTVMDTLQVAVESALAGVLFFFLVFAAFRIMRRGVTVWNVLFLAALVVVLIGYSPLSGMEFLTDVREWVLSVPVNAGVRGLLIGIAIGTVTVGVRLLIGQDRTFRE